MKPVKNSFGQWLKSNKEDIEYLLYVGMPAGVLMSLLSGGCDFSMLF